MPLSLQYKNNGQNVLTPNDDLKLLCFYIISCQNTGLLEVLTEVLQAFMVWFTVLNYLRNRFSNKKSESSPWAVSPCSISHSSWETFHGLYGANMPSHHLCTWPLVDPWLSHNDTSQQTPREALTTSTTLPWEPGLHPCCHSSCCLQPQQHGPPCSSQLTFGCSAHVSAFSILQGLPSAIPSSCESHAGSHIPLGQAWLWIWGMEELEFTQHSNRHITGFLKLTNVA